MWFFGETGILIFAIFIPPFLATSSKKKPISDNIQSCFISTCTFYVCVYLFLSAEEVGFDLVQKIAPENMRR